MVPGGKRSLTLSWEGGKQNEELVSSHHQLYSPATRYTEETRPTKTGNEAEEEEDAHVLCCGDGDAEDGEESD